VAPDQSVIEVVAAAGTSAMRAAIKNGIEGIVAECGGVAACGTCHVYVAPAFIDRLPAMTDNEDTLLDFTAADRCANSRLSCQIMLDDTLDGLVLQIPDCQL
jgi:2Fe-2S ferredoxin